VGGTRRTRDTSAGSAAASYANIATSVTPKGNIHLYGDEEMEFVVMTE